MKTLVYAILLILVSHASSRPNNLKISGGQTADIENHPWLVSIWQQLPHLDIICSGFLISPFWIVTSASCISKHNATYVRAGSSIHNVGGVTAEVTNKIAHPQYNHLNDANDIAVIKLLTPVSGVNIKPLALPDPKNIAVKTGDILTVAGWGQTESGNGTYSETLQEVRLFAITTADCSQMYGTFLNYQICGVGNGQEGVCTGDVGSPVLWNEKPVGLVSLYSTCGSVFPPIFTNLEYFLEWIHVTTGI